MLAGVFGGAMLAGQAPAPRVVNAAPVSFGREVRPILAGNCFKCHGPDEAARQGGVRLDTREGALAVMKDGRAPVVPGAPQMSRVMEVVTSADPDERMPPVEVSRHGLAAGDVEVLRRWIAEGGAYETHWSFVAPVKKAPPRVSAEGWCRGEMDRWVMAGLDAAGLKPSAEASKETLLRRVTLDLTGLPPKPEEVAAFVNDTSAGAYEKVVDRLLASPRYGEKWARWWLDMARYADTKGYEKDDRRTVWPYRDWVIRAFNEDMPFDRFTIEQLAGDMIPEATQNQILATAFHRNTMTNDEGGTDDEEFRVAAVVDRVNTTMEVWQGVTAGCAQCHTHKYDPITHEDYFRVFAVFNNTEDADRAPEETPYVRLRTEEQSRELAAAEARLAEVEREIAGAVAGVEAASYMTVLPAATAGEAIDVAVIDDLLPPLAKASVQGLGGGREWQWVGDAASGARAFGGATKGGAAQQYFEGALPALEIGAGDVLYMHVKVDEKNPPKQVMVQWFADEGGWEHRAFWGEDKLTYGGTPGAASKMRIGDLPEAGKWVRLEVDAAAVGLVGRKVTGWAFSQFDGAVRWDHAGVRTTRAVDRRHELSLGAWVDVVRSGGLAGVPEAVLAAAKADDGARDAEQQAALVEFYLRHVHAPTRLALAALDDEAAKLRATVAAINARMLAVPVMKELAGDARRKTHVLERGSFLSPAAEVSPGVPSVFEGASGASPGDRLAFARWLMSDANPLTARVIANRLWEQVWGVGIVETVEDFGTQGAWPSNQGLLDFLALRLRDGGWSVKGWLREVVTSAAYRQSSAASDELLERDPANRLLARGARFRLDGETIRDVSLAAAGLLSEKMYGPPVFPPQPEGVWMMIYSSDRWVTSKGEDRYRRGMYTFVRRTAPHPAMTTFDAPSREVCVSRRLRTNTPLQALVTLNDPAFVECAQAMARRVLLETGGDDAARAVYAMRLAAGRSPTPEESAALLALLESERKVYRADEGAAVKAATSVLGPLPEEMDAAEAAAWTAVCSVVLNLDETLTRE